MPIYTLNWFPWISYPLLIQSAGVDEWWEHSTDVASASHLWAGWWGGRWLLKKWSTGWAHIYKMYLLQQQFRWIPGLARYVSITHVYLALRKKNNHHKPSSRGQVWQNHRDYTKVDIILACLKPILLLKSAIFWQFAPKQKDNVYIGKDTILLSLI